MQLLILLVFAISNEHKAKKKLFVISSNEIISFKIAQIKQLPILFPLISLE
jgi:hypothetical protein